MTGRLSPADLALVHTFAYRQSSLRAGSLGEAGVVGAFPPRPPRPAPPRPAAGPDVHGAPNASALRTPSQRAGGCGARHRFSPSGGAANGMLLKTRTEDWVTPVVPASVPMSVLTCSGIIAEVRTATTAIVPSTRKSATRFIV